MKEFGDTLISVSRLRYISECQYQTLSMSFNCRMRSAFVNDRKEGVGTGCGAGDSILTSSLSLISSSAIMTVLSETWGLSQVEEGRGGAEYRKQFSAALREGCSLQ
jgi:hypothetical protein